VSLAVAVRVLLGRLLRRARAREYGIKELSGGDLTMNSSDPTPAADGLVFVRPGPGPQTHVLIVGVACYPNFRDGGANADLLSPIGQLTAPAISARWLADWFITEHAFPAAPLGSVALLLSEDPPGPYTPPGGQPVGVAPAMYDNLETAAQEWRKRGDGSERNQLVFIFCGHGYGFGDTTSLLLADFDFRKQNRWDRALDLGTFIAGMEACAASHQLFLIDACRRPHGDLLSPHAAIGRSPVQPVQTPRAPFTTSRIATTLFSTGEEEVARAKSGGLSIFAEALIRSFNGMAARDDEGDWRVSTVSLMEAVDHVSRRLTSQIFSSPQQPQGSKVVAFDLHFLQGAPISPIYVERGAPYYNQKGHIVYRGTASGSRECDSGEIEVDVNLPYGAYDLDLECSGAVVGSGSQRAAPTFKKLRLP
jgi:hypothetical protein